MIHSYIMRFSIFWHLYVLYTRIYITSVVYIIYITLYTCDLQLYEGVSLSSNSESQTEEQSFEYTLNNFYETL